MPEVKQTSESVMFREASRLPFIIRVGMRARIDYKIKLKKSPDPSRVYY
jgi:hypothetical protein